MAKESDPKKTIKEMAGRLKGEIVPRKIESSPEQTIKEIARKARERKAGVPGESSPEQTIKEVARKLRIQKARPGQIARARHALAKKREKLGIPKPSIAAKRSLAARQRKRKRI